MKRMYVYIALVGIGLAFFIEKKMSAPAEKMGTPAITIDGNVVITDKEFEEYVNRFIQAQSQQMPGFDFKTALAESSADQKRAFYAGIFKMLEDSALIQRDVEARGLNKTIEYQKNLKKMREVSNAEQAELEMQAAQIAFQTRLMEEIKPKNKELEAFYLAEQSSKSYMQSEPFVIKTAGKAEYAPFEQVKKQLEEIYVNTLFTQRYENELAKIKGQHKVEVNSTIIDRLSQ